MTYYSVLEVSPTHQDWIPDYTGPTKALLAKHGGKYLARTNNHQRLEGQGEGVTLRVIIEWPSKQAALDFMNDPEYAPYLKARVEGSVSHHVLIEGRDDLA
ncbi:DUF1330 domain-containing protein [Agarivorans sp. MS3-6]|uniref:DUF1330 domain-containing protein n=1 Tax=Agarivorans sp. TSD2052 TaxID=2937286 RepID=UPI00200FAD6F|nr:DUF1330 domain-containing protein [Agarivorans sp. TSD2052]UPW18318.1 DUF1330 domain-containing protein [Agarivorans sp. TSD2052]